MPQDPDTKQINIGRDVVRYAGQLTAEERTKVLSMNAVKDRAVLRLHKRCNPKDCPVAAIIASRRKAPAWYRVVLAGEA